MLNNKMLHYIFNYFHILDRSYLCRITTNTAEKWSSCGRDATILSATSRKTSRRPISWSLTSWCWTMSNYSLAEWSSSTIAKVSQWTTSLSGRSPWLKNTCITCRYVSLIELLAGIYFWILVLICFNFFCQSERSVESKNDPLYSNDFRVSNGSQCHDQLHQR